MSSSINDIIVDLIIVLALFFFIYRGFKNGFIKEFMSFFGMYVSVVISIRYMSDLAEILFGMTDVLSHSVVSILAFILIFVPLMSFFMFLTKKLRKISKFSFSLGSVDRIMGIVIGLLKGTIILSVCALIISLSALSGIFGKELNASQLYKPILLKRVLPLAYSVVKYFVWGKYKPFNLEIKETLNIQSPNPLDKRARDFIDEIGP